MFERGGLRGHADFARLWAAQAVSAFGSRITRTALPVIAVVTLGVPEAMLGVLGALQLAPGVVIAVFAGTFVDRDRKRRILIAADLARAAVVLSLTLAWALGALSMLHVILVGAVVGGASALFQITDVAYLPALIGKEHLAEGNSKLEATEAVAEITGPASAGVLIAALGAPLAVAIDAATYLWSAFMLGRIRTIESGARSAKRGGSIEGTDAAGDHSAASIERTDVAGADGSANRSGESIKSTDVVAADGNANHSAASIDSTDVAAADGNANHSAASIDSVDVAAADGSANRSGESIEGIGVAAADGSANRSGESIKSTDVVAADGNANRSGESIEGIGVAAADGSASRSGESIEGIGVATARQASGLRVGLRAVFGHRLVRPVVLAHMIWAVSGGFFMSLYALFLFRELGMSEATFGIVVAMGGIGSLFGALLSRSLAGAIGVGPTLLLTACCSLSGQLLIPLASGSHARMLAFLCAHQLISDGFAVAFVIQAVTLRQTVLPRALLGRANAAIHVCVAGVVPVAALGAGGLAATIGIRSAVWVGVLLGLAAPMFLLPLRHLRAMPAADP